MNSEEGKKGELIFRQYMADEMASREVARAKKALIQRYFTDLPPLVGRPAFFLPALGLALVCFLLFQIEKPAHKPFAEPLAPAPAARTPNPANSVPLLPSTSELRVAVEKQVVEKQIEKIIPAQSGTLEVNIRKVSSEVGSTMVYQKTYHQMPLTVIWVFPGKD